MQLLRSAILIEYGGNAPAEGIPQGESAVGTKHHYSIRYCDVESVILTSSGLLINTKVSISRS